MSSTYQNQISRQCLDKITELQEKLPAFCRDYINAVMRTKAWRTMRTYLERDLVFFRYLVKNHSFFMDKDICDIHICDLEHITLNDANAFLNSLYVSQADNDRQGDSNNTVDAYASALNSLFGWLRLHAGLNSNPFADVERRHRKEDHPVFLRGKENITFYEGILSGAGLTEKQLQYREKQHTAYRDYLICRIVGTTGIRVSELVGLDVQDMDLTNKCFYVIRKGHIKENEVYFSDELAQEISYYLDEERPLFSPAADEDAMFLVAQGKYKGKRLSVKSVETMVKRYAMAQGIQDAADFTVHKLRHTYAVNTLRAEGNLRLTQQLLGHKDISTTTIYARMLESDIKNARSLGEYREEKESKEKDGN